MCCDEASRSDTLTTARCVNTGLYRLVRLGNAASMGLKIRFPQGRAGSTPALGTNDFVSSLELIV